MPRKFIKLLVCLTALLASVAMPLVGQSAEADIRLRLKSKPLYLRGSWRDSHLRFDADGKLVGKSDPISFTLAGFDLDSVKLKQKGLILDGRRMGTEFTHDLPKRVELEGLRIEIATPANGDFKPALDAIFADDLNALVPSMPWYWQLFARCRLLSNSRAAGTGTEDCSEFQSTASTKWSGPGISPPKLKKQRDAEFNDYARGLKYGGATLMGMTVNSDGSPISLHILRPLGIGLDEQALAAVAQWQFKPAMQDGKPLRSQVAVEVGFHIF